MSNSHDNLAFAKAILVRAKDGDSAAVEVLRDMIHGFTRPGKKYPMPAELVIELAELCASYQANWIQEQVEKN